MNKQPTLFLSAFFSIIVSQSTYPAWSAVDKFDEHYVMAVDLYNDKHYDRAVPELDQAIAADPNRFEAYLRRARCYNQLRRAEDAIADLKKCQALKPDQAEVFDARCVSNLLLDNYAAALADCWRCVTIDPTRVRAYFRMTGVCEDRLDYANALKLYNAVIKHAEHKRDTARALCYRGTLYARMGNLSKALADHNAAIKLRPRFGNNFQSRGKVYYRFKKYKQAIEDAKHAIALNGKASGYYTALGAYYVLSGEPTKAVDALDKALSISPNSGSAHNNRGVALLKLGKIKQAKIEFDRAVEGDQGKELYYQNHAKLALRDDDVEDAVDDFVSMGNEKAPASWHEAQANHRIVIKQFTRVIKISPSEASNYYDRAISYFCVGEYSSAHHDLQTFLKLVQWKGDSPAFAAMLDSIALRNIGKKTEANDILTEAEPHLANTWTGLLLKYLKGAATAAEVIDLARQSNKESVARCFIGLNLLAEKKLSPAKEQLKWVREKTDHSTDEYALASSSLSRLEPKKGTVDHAKGKAHQLETFTEPQLIVK